MTYASANASQNPILRELDEIALATELLEAQTEGELGDVLRRAAEAARALAQPGALRRAVHSSGPEVLGGLAAGYVRRHTGDEFMARSIGGGLAGSAVAWQAVSMTISPNPYRGFRFPPAVIEDAVWLSLLQPELARC